MEIRFNDQEHNLAVVSSSEQDTLLCGRLLGAELPAAMTVLLSGDLGSGKTVLVRGIGEALGASRVRSPSFTLVNEYRTKTRYIAHADIYRLQPSEVDDLGLEDYLADGCVLLVEWPERWLTPPTDDLIRLSFDTIDIVSHPDERLLTFCPVGERAKRVVLAFYEALRKVC